jgi:hypothetical protein
MGAAAQRFQRALESTATLGYSTIPHDVAQVTGEVPTPAGSPVRMALAYERSDDWPLTFAELHVAVIELAV